MPAEPTRLAGALDEASLACCRDLAGRLFPWDINRALELALLKTFCLPSISSLLHRTGAVAAAAVAARQSMLPSLALAPTAKLSSRVMRRQNVTHSRVLFAI